MEHVSCLRDGMLKSRQKWLVVMVVVGRRYPDGSGGRVLLHLEKATEVRKIDEGFATVKRRGCASERVGILVVVNFPD